ncbi:MAG: peptidase U35, partial [Gammaproteobacteria bacterium]|nr:peptidase U35 [Gammaproteobacteria bacterium]
IAAGCTIDQARAAATTELARRDAAAGGHRNTAPTSHFLRGSSDVDIMKRQMGDALAATRFGVRGIDLDANPYRHATAADVCRDLLEARGERTGFMSRAQIVQRALGTGDLPNLLASSGHRGLQETFAALSDGVHRAAKKSTIADFRAKSLIRMSEAPDLRPVNEHGEFTYGAMTETAESYRLLTYGRMVSLTRQAIINDDLSALQRIPQAFARAAADLRNSKLVELLALNSATGPAMEDGTVCFHIDHANIQTGAGSALSLTSLATARTAMRLRTDVGGRTLLDLVPMYLIVPAALENTGRQLLAQIAPTTVSDVNAAGGGLQLIVDPRLDSAVSATVWYLASDPQAGGLEYSFLEGAEGPQLEQEWGVDVDGVLFKCRVDFGAAVTEWRTLHKSAGA